MDFFGVTARMKILRKEIVLNVYESAVSMNHPSIPNWQGLFVTCIVAATYRERDWLMSSHSLTFTCYLAVSDRLEWGDSLDCTRYLADCDRIHWRKWMDDETVASWRLGYGEDTVEWISWTDWGEIRGSGRMFLAREEFATQRIGR